MDLFDRVVEEKIRKARETGEFDNLPGKGKPLRLEENAFELEESRLANRLLKNNGFSLPWMEDGQEIEALLQQARQRLRIGLQNAAVPAQRQLALEQFGAEIKLLNQRILRYNLRVPTPALQRPPLEAAREIEIALADSAPGS